MSKIVYSSYQISYAGDLDVYFEYKNSVVFTSPKTSDRGENNITIINKSCLNDHSGIHEQTRYSRSDILSIQGILSFFSGIAITVYENISSATSINPIKYKKKNTHLIIDGLHHTSDLKKILIKVEEEPQLMISLLDRWRKSVYLLEESTDANLYFDEATLGFFHIFEIFGEKNSPELKSKLDKDIQLFLSTYYENYYLTNDQKKDKITENLKTFKNLLIGNHLTLSVKIKDFLKKNDMLDDNVAFFIDSMIKIRNAIAHGRITYQEKFIWPLSPFFNLSKDSYQNINFLYILSAKMISAYAGINRWDNEWHTEKQNLLPPLNTLVSFLVNPHSFKHSISKEALFQGNEYNITWVTIFNHYVKNAKKIPIKTLEMGLKEYFISTNLNEDNASDIFNISIIFSDSEDIEIKGKAIENIKSTINKGWHRWGNFKDAYSYLEFYNLPPVWYKQFLDNLSYKSY
ncbi:hypothetical protein HCJ66_01500 [Listeria sp. FSL L7-1582]|uniref:hypothetical protein n=1 Tax=Listeria portnoyi TaxID=2713504 RepID=UPI00164D24B2|nr:hypothetical protein [Listeria portnoyi]MBC6308218.1 hypothetical protein [Listeria portnoyi]